jgi:hypothetical protein
MKERMQTNRELTGHPEVPWTLRNFRDETIHFADAVGISDSGNLRDFSAR